MSVSIIMTVYNKSKYVLKTINSVLNQTYQDFEFIIIDDGSTDDSLRIINTVKDKKIKLYSHYNIGISGARNFGVRISENELIAFIDADDEWDSNYLSEIINLKESYNNCKAFVTAYIKRYPKYDEVVVVNSEKETGIIKDYFLQRITGWGVHTSSVVIYKEDILKIGGFPVLLGSEIENKCYVININGDIIFEYPSQLVLERGKWVSDTENLVPKSKSIDNIKSFKVSVPGIIAEDQYLWDMLNTRYEYAYSKKILSYWNGNVLNQVTCNINPLPIYPHLISLTKINGNTNSSLLRYIKYLDQSLILRFKYFNSLDFVNILESHNYFSRNKFPKAEFNKYFIKFFILLISYKDRINKKIKKYL